MLRGKGNTTSIYYSIFILLHGLDLRAWPLKLWLPTSSHGVDMCGILLELDQWYKIFGVGIHSIYTAYDLDLVMG